MTVKSRHKNTTALGFGSEKEKHRGSRKNMYTDNSFEVVNDVSQMTCTKTLAVAPPRPGDRCDKESEKIDVRTDFMVHVVLCGI